MEKCYEFLFCEKTDCIRRGIEDRQCWEIEGTACYEHGGIFENYLALTEQKIEACKRCAYYKIYNEDSARQ